MTYSYITVLTNWLLGYDKYLGIYSKSNLEKSTYPNEFYVLKENELDIGLNKANNLLNKLNIENNKIIRIETQLPHVYKNIRNGLGWVVSQNYIPVNSVFVWENNQWKKVNVEDITALAYCLDDKILLPYSQLKPRSLSILPVAKACQASCQFCFSESSISFDQKNSIIDLGNLDKVCKQAATHGAERFVITGGGEPTLIKFENLLNIITLAKRYFKKVVLISNGLFLSEKEDDVILMKAQQLIDAGLDVLSLSYHHYNAAKNSVIMGKIIRTNRLLNLFKQHSINKKITIRLICVLQKSGVNNEEEIENYIGYAIEKQVAQVCFKELYISSTTESLYSGQKENKYSEDNQIPLSILINYLDKNALKVAELPWGSPVYSYKDVIDVAAYTEPSVGWERKHGVARSWNLMADGQCFASLEDKNSLVEINNEL